MPIFPSDFQNNNEYREFAKAFSQFFENFAGFKLRPVHEKDEVDGDWINFKKYALQNTMSVLDTYTNLRADLAAETTAIPFILSGSLFGRVCEGESEALRRDKFFREMLVKTIYAATLNHVLDGLCRYYGIPRSVIQALRSDSALTYVSDLCLTEIKQEMFEFRHKEYISRDQFQLYLTTVAYMHYKRIIENMVRFESRKKTCKEKNCGDCKNGGEDKECTKEPRRQAEQFKPLYDLAGSFQTYDPRLVMDLFSKTDLNSMALKELGFVSQDALKRDPSFTTKLKKQYLSNVCDTSISDEQLEKGLGDVIEALSFSLGRNASSQRMVNSYLWPSEEYFDKLPTITATNDLFEFSKNFMRNNKRFGWWIQKHRLSDWVDDMSEYAIAVSTEICKNFKWLIITGKIEGGLTDSFEQRRRAVLYELVHNLVMRCFLYKTSEDLLSSKKECFLKKWRYLAGVGKGSGMGLDAELLHFLRTIRDSYNRKSMSENGFSESSDLSSGSESDDSGYDYEEYNDQEDLTIQLKDDFDAGKNIALSGIYLIIQGLLEQFELKDPEEISKSEAMVIERFHNILSSFDCLPGLKTDPMETERMPDFFPVDPDNKDKKEDSIKKISRTDLLVCLYNDMKSNPNDDKKSQLFHELLGLMTNPLFDRCSACELAQNTDISAPRSGYMLAFHNGGKTTYRGSTDLLQDESYYQYMMSTLLSKLFISKWYKDTMGSSNNKAEKPGGRIGRYLRNFCVLVVNYYYTRKISFHDAVFVAMHMSDQQNIEAIRKREEEKKDQRKTQKDSERERANEKLEINDAWMASICTGLLELVTMWIARWKTMQLSGMTKADFFDVTIADIELYSVLGYKLTLELERYGSHTYFTDDDIFRQMLYKEAALMCPDRELYEYCDEMTDMWRPEMRKMRIEARIREREARKAAKEGKVQKAEKDETKIPEKEPHYQRKLVKFGSKKKGKGKSKK